MIADFIKSFILFLIPKVAIALGFLALIVFPHSELDVEEYSNLSLMLSLAVLLSLLPSTCYGQSNLKNSVTSNDYFITGMLFIITNLILSVLIALISKLFWVAVVCFLNSCALYLNLYLQSKNRIFVYSALETLRGVAIIVSVYLFHIFIIEKDSEIYLIALTISYSIIIVPLIISLYLDRGTPLKIEKIKMVFTNSIKYGGFLSIWVVFYMSISYLDRVNIQHLDAEFMGSYDLIYRIIPFLCSPILLLVLQKLFRDKRFDNKVEAIKLILIATASFFIMFFFILGSFFILNKFNFEKFLPLGMMGLINLNIEFFLLLLCSFLWQLSMLYQKLTEQSGDTKFMAAVMFIILVSYYLLSNFVSSIYQVFYINIILSLGYSLIMLRRVFE